MVGVRAHGWVRRTFRVKVVTVGLGSARTLNESPSQTHVFTPRSANSDKIPSRIIFRLTLESHKEM